MRAHIARVYIVARKQSREKGKSFFTASFFFLFCVGGYGVREDMLRWCMIVKVDVGFGVGCFWLGARVGLLRCDFF